MHAFIRSSFRYVFEVDIDDYELLDAVCRFTYLGYTITDNLSLDAEIDKRVGKAAVCEDKYGSLLCYQHIAV